MTEIIHNRYRIVRELGQGGMGAVYLVQDMLHDDRLLTLKMIRPDLVGERNLAQFKYEFAALSQLRHPNLVAVHDFGSISGSREYFYTMEYVAGQDLLELAAQHSAAPAGYTWLYDITAQICRALQYIHSRGLIHYDVKPRNVRITPDGLVKLLDMGLVGEARGEGQMRIRGTPEYIAPELIRGDPVDHHADLYSLGVTLYEIVAGRLPFAGDSSIEVLRQHVELTPPAPREFVATVPEALQTIILKLLAKDPAERYDSANQVIQAIGGLAGLDLAVDSKQARWSHIQGAGFIGREFELARLQGLLMRAVQSRGGLVLVTGGVGVGKTRLIDELRRHAQLQRALVCEGACSEFGSSPYQPWVAVLGQMASYQRSAAPETLSTYGPALLRLMPELADSFGLPAVEGEEPEKHQELLQAVSRFLLACDRPLLIALKDLHYASVETVELLDYLGQHARQARWLLCATYREHQLAPHHPLHNLQRRARVVSQRQESQTPPDDQPYDLFHLDTLDESDLAELLRSMLGVTDLPSGLLPHLMAQTGGNPLFVENVMHGLVEQDLLHYDGQHWSIELTDLQQLPASIQEAAQRRLARLEADSLELLQWAAVTGQSLDLALLAELCMLPDERVLALVTAAVEQHVLKMAEQDGQTVYHLSSDPMREALYQTLTPQERVARHRRVGETMRRLYADQAAGILTWHFERAGDVDLALHYAHLAADQARQASANETAVAHYTHALELVHAHDELHDAGREYALLAGRQECYRLLADSNGQQSDLEQMAAIARQLGDARRQIQVATHQVGLANEVGNHVDAQQAARLALELARQIDDPQLTADSLTALGNTLYLVSDYEAARSNLQQALELYRQLNDPAGEAQSLWGLGMAAVRSGSQAEALDHFERALPLFRAVGNQQGEADVLNALGITVSDLARARSYHEQSLAIAQSLGNLSSQARTYNNLALLYWNLGLYSRARDYIERGVQIARDLRMRSRLVHFMETIGRVYIDLGEYVQAHEALEEGRALSIDLGNRWSESTYWMMLGRVALLRGRPAEARQLIQTACDMQREQGTFGFLAASLAWLGAVHLALGDWPSAHRCTAEAVSHLAAVGNAGDYPPQDVHWLHYQVLKSAPGRAADDPLDDETWSALQQAREAMMNGITTLSDKGLRRNYLNRVKINRDIVTEWTRQAAGRVAGQEQPLQVLAPPADWGAAVEPEQVEERFKRVLDISARMNETHEIDQLLDFVMDQVIELSGAERGFLVLIDKAGQMDFHVARGIARDELERARSDISYTVIGTVAQTRAAVLLQDALADERFGSQRSVLELNLRSVFCVPLLTPSALVGVIYADNRSVSGRFTQSDVDLMTIFANQAAIAIDNARLYEETVRANIEMETWAHTLEQRVAQRTVELQQANQALQRRAVQLETSSQVGQQATSILELDHLLAQVVELIQERFGYYFVGAWLIAAERGDVELLAGTGVAGDDLCAQGFCIPLDATSLIVNVCRSGQPRVVGDVHAEADYMKIESLPEARSELVLPLRVGGETAGVLDILSSQPHAFGAEEQMVLQTLADQIAIAIRNAQLYKTERYRRFFAESLVETGRALSSNLDLRAVPGLILEQLEAVVPYERGAVLLQQGAILQNVALRGFPETGHEIDLRVPIRDTEDDVFYRIAMAREPIRVDDVTHDPGWQQLDWLPLNRSWVGVPLISKGRVIGMISLTRREAAAFSQDDVTLVQAFAGQAAIALENASLYAEITRLNEQLEQMVQQRTQELNKAYRTLAQLDQAKTDFIEVTAHELRTPLTLIRGYSQVMVTHPLITDNPEIRDLLQGILTGENRLLDVINSMLDAVKIDAKVMRTYRKPVVPAAVVDSVIDEFSAALHERHLALKRGALDDLPLIRGDPDLLRKVFYHLMSNAIKYTPDGGVIAIEGQALVDDEGCECIEVVVADSGIGIDPQHQELIFEKFYQTGEVSLHSSGRTKFKAGGPGLGLAIARGIVLAHGGRIWVESPGYDEEHCPGSRFTVRLPVGSKG